MVHILLRPTLKMLRVQTHSLSFMRLQGCASSAFYLLKNLNERKFYSRRVNSCNAHLTILAKHKGNFWTNKKCILNNHGQVYVGIKVIIKG